MSEHFDGKRFHNQVGAQEEHGPGALIKWMMNREQGPWEALAEAAPGPQPPERVGQGELRVTFVNHATLLVQVDGVNVLTDPMWSERASPVPWAGPRRMRPPGLRFEDLPPIDVVLLSHNHYDHFDRPTLLRLHAEHAPRFVVLLGNDLLLAEWGIDGALALDWWEGGEAAGLRIFGVPARHFSARGLRDRNRNLWGGFVIESQAGPVYFAGDTGWSPHFEAIRTRFGPVRLAMLPIGAFRPRWFMRQAHISPKEAYFAHLALGASTSVAMHYGTFPLADDGMHEPVEQLERVLAAAEAEGSKEAFWILGFGEGRDVPPLPPGS